MATPTIGPEEEVPKVRLRGRDVSAGERIRVWYKEDDIKVEYRGTVTRVDAKVGMRVWFDACSYLEQEWVNNDDEWRFEDEDIQDLDVGHAGTQPTDEDLEAQCEYDKIRLKFGKRSILLPTKASKKKGTEHVPAEGLEGAKADAEGGTAHDHVIKSAYNLTATGIFLSESFLPPGVPSSLSAYKAPRRAPGTLLAKYGKCEFSGLPAIYCDPVTRRRFGDLNAFQMVRAKYAPDDSKGGRTPQERKQGRPNRGATPR